MLSRFDWACLAFGAVAFAAAGETAWPEALSGTQSIDLPEEDISALLGWRGVWTASASACRSAAKRRRP